MDEFICKKCKEDLISCPKCDEMICIRCWEHYPPVVIEAKGDKDNDENRTKKDGT